jgi:preprotein translocase subunit SecA
MEEGEPIEHGMVTRAIGTAQKRVETRNFEIRKHLLEYDDVMNKQREIVYGMRREILEGESQEETVLEWIDEVAAATVARYAPEGTHPEAWDVAGLNEALHRLFDFRLPAGLDVTEMREPAELVTEVTELAVKAYREREAQLGPEMFHRLERWIVLGLRWEDGEFRGIDQLWKDHLLSMDHLKEGIGLRGYGQRDPLTEYKKEAFEMFQEMVDHLKEVVLEQLFKVRMVREEAAPIRVASAAPAPRWQESHGDGGDIAGGRPAAARPESRPVNGAKVGRNDPCPCGSGKKYKKCHALMGG